MADQNQFWLAKCWNWSGNGQWPAVISSTVTELITDHVSNGLVSLVGRWATLNSLSSLPRSPQKRVAAHHGPCGRIWSIELPGKFNHTSCTHVCTCKRGSYIPFYSIVCTPLPTIWLGDGGECTYFLFLRDNIDDKWVLTYIWTHIWTHTATQTYTHTNAYTHK